MDLNKELSAWIAHLKANTALSDRTIEFYYENCRAVLSILEQQGIQDIGELNSAAIYGLLDEMERRCMATSTRKDYLSALKKYCSYAGLDPFDQVTYSLPQDVRPTVDWLTPPQIHRLLDWLESEGSSLQRTTIHLMLTMGLRRIEVIRLKISDINWKERYVDVRGKGRGGVKLRRVPFSPRTQDILSDWMGYRQLLIDRAKIAAAELNADPGPIPEEVFVWRKTRNLYAYDDDGWGLDKMVSQRVSKAVGFPIRNHTLRRTFGRTLWLAGVAVETIATILGHQSTEQTLKYIGVNMDDMRSAMQHDYFTVTKEIPTTHRHGGIEHENQKKEGDTPEIYCQMR